MSGNWTISSRPHGLTPCSVHWMPKMTAECTISRGKIWDKYYASKLLSGCFVPMTRLLIINDDANRDSGQAVAGNVDIQSPVEGSR
jgi:hypothetical protein